MRISQCFNRAATTYDHNCGMQVDVGHQLITSLVKHLCDEHMLSVLDLGCGTGLITKQLAKNVRYRELHAVDIAEQCLIRAQHHLLPYRAQVYRGDFNSLVARKKGFDLVFANMSLQWGLSLARTFAGVYGHLANCGILGFSVPLAGTLRELDLVAKQDFYEHDYITKVLRDSGFVILEAYKEVKQIEFATLLDGLRSIKAVGATYTACKSKTYPFGLRDILHKKCLLSYNIGYYIAKKVSAVHT